MIGDAASYVASRVSAASENAAEQILRRTAWAIGVGVLLLGALAFALIALFSYLVPIYGQMESAAMIAVGCLALAALIVITRSIVSAWRNWRREAAVTTSESSAPVLGVINEEAREAVDYFGAAKVMATAFMFGFTAARRIKS